MSPFLKNILLLLFSLSIVSCNSIRIEKKKYSKGFYISKNKVNPNIETYNEKESSVTIIEDVATIEKATDSNLSIPEQEIVEENSASNSELPPLISKDSKMVILNTHNFRNKVVQNDEDNSIIQPTTIEPTSKSNGTPGFYVWTVLFVAALVLQVFAWGWTAWPLLLALIFLVFHSITLFKQTKSFLKGVIIFDIILYIPVLVMYFLFQTAIAFPIMYGIVIGIAVLMALIAMNQTNKEPVTDYRKKKITWSAFAILLIVIPILIALSL